MDREVGGPFNAVTVVHDVLESRFRAAMAEIARLQVLRAQPRAIRVIEEEFG